MARPLGQQRELRNPACPQFHPRRARATAVRLVRAGRDCHPARLDGWPSTSREGGGAAMGGPPHDSHSAVFIQMLKGAGLARRARVAVGGDHSL
jgi:hypothetical protein